MWPVGSASCSSPLSAPSRCDWPGTWRQVRACIGTSSTSTTPGGVSWVVGRPTLRRGRPLVRRTASAGGHAQLRRLPDFGPALRSAWVLRSATGPLRVQSSLLCCGGARRGGDGPPRACDSLAGLVCARSATRPLRGAGHLGTLLVRAHHRRSRDRARIPAVCPGGHAARRTTRLGRRDLPGAGHAPEAVPRANRSSHRSRQSVAAAVQCDGLARPARRRLTRDLRMAAASTVAPGCHATGGTVGTALVDQCVDRHARQSRPGWKASAACRQWCRCRCWHRA